MRGVMIVVDKLDTSILAANPSTADAVWASAREVVEYWEFDGLKDEVDAVLANRSYKTGKEMFHVAACMQCHKIAGAGESIGPDLTDVRTRYSPLDLLEHILEPSLDVADEYKTFIILTTDNEEYYGQIVAQDDDTMKILDNPLKPETAITVRMSDVKKTDPIDISPMPTDLLITLEKEEIWDLLAFVLSGDDSTHAAFN